MPLTKIQRLSDQGAWALWHITESESELHKQLKVTNECREELRSISHANKKLEWLGSRLLIQELALAHQVPYQGVWKDLHGKPQLRRSNWHISVAHCFPYAAAAINKMGSIGIDIEKPRSQLQTISRRFLSDEEFAHAANDIDLLCHYWTGKEALYKIYGRKKLIFKENILLRPLSDNPSEFKGRIVTDDKETTYQVHYQFINGHWIAHSRET